MVSPLPGLPKLGALQKVPRLRRPPVRNTGPRELRLQSDPVQKAGPGAPPEGFITAHQSKTEWVWYWASSRVLKDPRDPRKGPFVGGATWQYQKAIDGGRIIGGQVVDFVYLLEKNKTLGVRIQTEHFHIMTDAATQLQDFFLKTSQRAVDQVIDVYDQDWLWDASGQAACAAVANALKGVQAYAPPFAGRSQRIRGGLA
jgi:hypothetical protein